MTTKWVELEEDEDYVIIHRKGEVRGESIDISYASNIIRLYRDEPWKVHPMNKDSMTSSIEVLDHS